MKSCTIKIKPREGLDVLVVDGSLDSHTFYQLENALDELREQGRTRVVLDCGLLNYICSSGLGALIGFARKAKEQGGDLKLARLSTKIQNIVELLGMHKILEIYPDVSSASASFS